MSKIKNYFLEEDVLALSGEEALQKFGEIGNRVFINYEQIEFKSRDSKNRNKYDFQRVLRFINSNGVFDPDKKEVKLNSGGVISWGEVPKDCIYISKEPALISKYKREGKLVDEPKFLRYGHETLNLGLVDITFNNNPKDKDLLKEFLIDSDFELYNNQFLRINQSGIIYQVKYQLQANGDNTRYTQLDDFNLATVNPNTITSKIIPGFKFRNLEQQLAYLAISDPQVEIMFLVGGAGSGKTVISYGCALESILGNEKQRKNGEIKENILLFKSDDLIGGDKRYKGFLPGSLDEKTSKFMQSYEDAHNLCGIDVLNFEELMINPKKLENSIEFKKQRDEKCKVEFGAGNC